MVTLSGVHATSHVGTLSVPHVIGVHGTGAVGSLKLSASAALTGVVGTTALGLPIGEPQFTANLTGVVGTSAVGAIIATITSNASITGVAGLGQVGGLVTSPDRNTLSLVSLYPIDVSTSEYALVGIAGANFPANFSQFSFSAWCCKTVNIQMPQGFSTPNLQMALSPTLISIKITDAANQTLFTGVWMNPWPTQNEYHVLFSVDTIAQVYTLYVSNQLWTPQAVSFPNSGLIHNDLTVLPTNLTLTGVEATGDVGVLSVFAGRQIGITGVTATGQVGTLRTEIDRSIAGVAATGRVGTLSTTGNQLVSIGGVTAIGHIGTVVPLVTLAPAQAASAGFTNLVFSDDFTSTSTITLTNQTGVQRPQYKWFPASWGGNLTSPTNIQVNTTWHAGDANMAAQGVSPTSPTLSNASPAGGIVKLQGGASNATLISVDGWATTLPTVGVWNTGYFEAYIQYQPSLLNVGTSANGWPAWWSWSVENLRGLGFGGSSFTGPYTEIDFWEYAVAGNGLTWGGGAYHGSMTGGYSYTDPNVTVDNNWHTMGLLWTPTTLDFYYDNLHVGSTATPSADLMGEQQFVMIGCGLRSTAPLPIAIYVDWVRVWQ